MTIPISVAGRFLYLFPGLEVLQLPNAQIGVPQAVEESERVFCTAVGSKVGELIRDVEDSINIVFTPAPHDTARSTCPDAEQTLRYLFQTFRGMRFNAVWPSSDRRLFTDEMPFNGLQLLSADQLRDELHQALAQFEFFGQWREELLRRPVTA